MQNNHTLPILSLIVAALAVFVGPIISWIIAKKHTLSSEKNIRLQTITSIRIANKQIVAPMRQAWINNLRDLIAELTGKCAHYWDAGFEERRDDEYQRITELQYKVSLFINPKEQKHIDLLQQVERMIMFLEHGKEADENFWKEHKKVIETSQEVLKSEWKRVKEVI